MQLIIWEDGSMNQVPALEDSHLEACYNGECQLIRCTNGRFEFAEVTQEEDGDAEPDSEVYLYSTEWYDVDGKRG